MYRYIEWIPCPDRPVLPNNENTIKPIYNVANENGGTTRVIIDEVQKEELTVVKSFRKISNHKLIEDIVENPENYFDDNVIIVDEVESEASLISFVSFLAQI